MRALSPYHGHWPTVALSHAIGAAGGVAAQAAHLPLPWLVGPLVAVAATAIAGLRPLGHHVQAPQRLRMLFVPIIGVSIGTSFRPEILEEIDTWWPSLVALCLYIPALHWAGYRLVRAVGSADRVTAFYGTAPGGLIEAVEMGIAHGADARMLTLLQFLRLILTIILVPLAFTLMSGHAVGSASGVALPGARAPLGPADVAILSACGVAGALAGLRLRLPAGHVTGPLLLSGLAHLAGLTDAAVPGWLVVVTQLVIGTSLGVRFAGMRRVLLFRALRLSALHAALTLTAAAAVAFALAPHVGEPAAATFLAFAPGGLAEMGLIALSLDMSVIYVTAHHVLRILLAVSVARVFSRRILPGPGAAP